MIRWKYLLPRLGILLILILMVNLLSNPLTRLLVIHSAQAVTGAKVEIGQMDVSLWSGYVDIRNFQMADASKPMQNLMQADYARLDLNQSDLLHRRLVIDQATLNGVQFGTPRTESGALDKRAARDSSDSALMGKLEGQIDKLKQQGKQWADQLQTRLPAMVEAELETVRVGNEIRGRWPKEFERQRLVASDLQLRARNLKQELETRSDNPLRDLEKYRLAMLEAHSLVSDFQSARQSVHTLANQFHQDRQNLVDAKQRDQAKLLAIKTKANPSPQAISELLLSQQQSEALDELTGWIKWFRESVPDSRENKKFKPVRDRGFNVQFQKEASLLVRKLDMTGEGTVDGKPVQFTGVANNLSTTPELLSEPATFQLSGHNASFSAPILVTGTVDRRGPQKIDSFNISCPQLASKARKMGSPDSLAIDLKTGTTAFQLEATIIDDQLTGVMKIKQSNVNMTLASLQLDDSPELMQSVNQQIASIDSFDIDIQLSGTVDKPIAQLKSDLGQRVSAVVGNSLQTALLQQAQRKGERLQTVLNNQLAEFDQTYSINTREILAMLSQDVTLVADLQKLNPQGILDGLKIPGLDLDGFRR